MAGLPGSGAVALTAWTHCNPNTRTAASVLRRRRAPTSLTRRQVPARTRDAFLTLRRFLLLNGCGTFTNPVYGPETSPSASPQFADGVYLILLMGLLEDYFVPLHHFYLTPDSFDQKVRVPRPSPEWPRKSSSQRTARTCPRWLFLGSGRILPKTKAKPDKGDPRLDSATLSDRDKALGRAARIQVS